MLDTGLDLFESKWVLVASSLDIADTDARLANLALVCPHKVVRFQSQCMIRFWLAGVEDWNYEMADVHLDHKRLCLEVEITSALPAGADIQ